MIDSLVGGRLPSKRPLTARPFPWNAPFNLQFGTTSPALTYDAAMMQRLLAAYRAAQEHASTSGIPGAQADMWDTIIGQEMKPFVAAIEEGDTYAMFRYISHIGRDYVWFGGLTLGIDGYTPRHWKNSRVAQLYWEKLVALGEACGALCIENPESGPYQCNLRIDPVELIGRLEAQLGASLSPPDQILPTSGIQVGSSVYHYRHINAIYAARMVANLTPDGGRVAEIGGGLGLVALYANRMKRLDYVIYDLPVSCMISGFFLLCALGAGRVSLYGEEAKEGAIHVRPFWTVSDAASSSFDLVVNQDGLNEIDSQTVQFLLRNIERTTRSNFLSINHETFGSDRRVADYMAAYTTMRRVWRSKTWVREGYVDELYQVQR